MFLERELISQGVSGSHIDLEEIQESTDNEPLVDTSTQPELLVEPVDESLPLRKTPRVSKHSHFYGFHITTEGDTLICNIKIDQFG